MKALVIAAADLPNAQLYGLRDNDRWIACAQSVTYDDVVIFGNDGTLPEGAPQRRADGVDRRTSPCRSSREDPDGGGRAGSGSERNYLRCGFQIAYTRTHYVRTVL